MLAFAKKNCKFARKPFNQFIYISKTYNQLSHNN